MEREIILSGIGGQSVQLAAGILARAAVAEGRHVLLLGTYGGTMRGGPTDSTVVIGEGPIATPPIVARAWAVLAMHHAFFAPTARKLRAGSVVFTNAPLFRWELDRQAQHVFEVPALEIAAAQGQPLAASLVLLAAFAGRTGLVGEESLVDAMREAVPAYRHQHLEANAKALRAGYAWAPESSGAAVPAWREAS